MSTSAYYNFITADAHKTPTNNGLHSIEAVHRQGGVSSPASFTTSSSSNSSSSLYQFNSLTATSVASASSSSCSSSSSSSTSSSSSRYSSSASKSQTNTSATNRYQNHRSDLSRHSSLTPASQNHSHHHVSQLFHSHTLHSLQPKPLKPFKTSSDYLEAMKEDLAEWLNRLYIDLDLTPENFFNQLETGWIICRHANNVTQMGRNFIIQNSQQIQQTTLDDHSINSSNNLSGIQVGHTVNHHKSPSPTESDLCSPTDNKPLSPFQSLTGSLSSPRPNSKTSINWFTIRTIPFRQDVQPGTFFARDNICQFILWCRSINVLDCLLFETDDLVARKNEKSFILCLLEVARIGFRVGMPTPLIIQFEQEIDREIENDAKLQKESEEKQNGDDDTIGSYPDHNDEQASLLSDDAAKLDEDSSFEIPFLSSLDGERKEVSKDEIQIKETEDNNACSKEEEEDFGPKPQVVTNDLVSLHEKVVQLLCQCTCATQFPMVRVGDNGKYKVGDKLIIFVRILRRHIMVRVGGGWQELSEFLRVKDPCRSRTYQANHHHNSNSNNNNNNNNNHQQQQQQQHQQKQQHLHHYSQLQQQAVGNNRSLLPTSISVSRSQLVESSHQLNRGLNQQFKPSAGQRLISGSASMSWLSHNS